MEKQKSSTSGERNDLGCGMGVWVLPVITTSSVVIKNAENAGKT